MKLRLSKIQFFALYDLLQSMIIAANPKGIEARLLHSILIGVYKKFYTKAFNKDKRSYTIKLNDEEACSWWLFFSKCQFKRDMVFETALIIKINNTIHQKFAA